MYLRAMGRLLKPLLEELEGILIGTSWEFLRLHIAVSYYNEKLLLETQVFPVKL